MWTTPLAAPASPKKRRKLLAWALAVLLLALVWKAAPFYFCWAWKKDIQGVWLCRRHGPAPLAGLWHETWSGRAWVLGYYGFRDDWTEFQGCPWALVFTPQTGFYLQRLPR